MTRPETLPVYVVPVPVMGFRRRFTGQECHRIVGVQDHDDILWTPEFFYRRSTYTLSDAEQIHLPSTPEFSEKLRSFYWKFLTEDSEMPNEEYNCHLLGRWMGTSEPQTHPDPTSPPHEVIERGRKSMRPLHLGQLGVVGGVLKGKPDANHSVVGLGKRSRVCLQIDRYMGEMITTTFQQAINRYTLPEYRNENGYKPGIYRIT